MSIFYALLVIADVMDKMLQVHEGGVRLTKLFLSLWSALFIAAVLHPREIGCIVFSVAYLVLIPATHLLLNLYSIIHLNNISWGTREVRVEEMEQSVRVCYIVSVVSHKRWSIGLIPFSFNISETTVKRTSSEWSEI